VYHVYGFLLEHVGGFKVAWRLTDAVSVRLQRWVLLLGFSFNVQGGSVQLRCLPESLGCGAHVTHPGLCSYLVLQGLQPAAAQSPCQSYCLLGIHLGLGTPRLPLARVPTCWYGSAAAILVHAGCAA
jgi:hypothetical protein